MSVIEREIREMQEMGRRQTGPNNLMDALGDLRELGAELKKMEIRSFQHVEQATNYVRKTQVKRK